MSCGWEMWIQSQGRQLWEVEQMSPALVEDTCAISPCFVGNDGLVWDSVVEALVGFQASKRTRSADYNSSTRGFKRLV